MNLLTEHAPLIISLLGGGQIVTLVGVMLLHQRSKRKQSDDVMTKQVSMSMERERVRDERIAKLEAQREVDRLEAEHREHLCEAKLDRMRHRQRNSEAMFDTLFAALKFAPAERVSEVLRDFYEDYRRRRDRWASEDASGGDVRNEIQAIVSGASLVKDAFERSAAPAAA